jgi:type II secretory pathway component PulF
MSRINVDIDSTQKAWFCQQLWSLLKEGEALCRALKCVSEKSSNYRMKKAIDRIVERLNDAQMMISGEWLDEFHEFRDGIFDCYLPLAEECWKADHYLPRMATQYEIRRKSSPTCTLTPSEPLAIFTEVCSELMRFGTSQMDALGRSSELLATRGFPILSQAIQEVTAKIDEGYTLGEAMALRPEVFPPEYVEYVRNAEKEAECFAQALADIILPVSA